VERGRERGGGGEEGRAQPKSGGPASPKGETLLAYMRSERKEPATTCSTPALALSEKERELGGHTTEGRRRDGSRRTRQREAGRPRGR